MTQEEAEKTKPANLFVFLHFKTTEYFPDSQIYKSFLPSMAYFAVPHLETIQNDKSERLVAVKDSMQLFRFP